MIWVLPSHNILLAEMPMKLAIIRDGSTQFVDLVDRMAIDVVGKRITCPIKAPGWENKGYEGL